MGSDNGSSRRRSNADRLRSTLVALAALLVTLVLVSSYLGTDQQDQLLLRTFDPSDTAGLPAECVESDVLSKLNQVQGFSHDRALVIACHRVWCNGYGHCEPCSGIGDRNRFALSLATDALERGVPIEIDAPQPGLLLRSDAVYRSWYDKVRLFGVKLSAVLHWRDYDVSSRNVNRDEWGMSMKRTYVHMTPSKKRAKKPYHLRTYDPCLFHALFRPDAELQREIDANLNQMRTNKKLGIHLRAGDTVAFDIDNQDVRAVSGSGGLEKAVQTMLDCADDLAKKMNSDGKEEQEPITYFFATDSAEAKALAVRLMDNRRGSAVSAKISTTKINPASYLEGISGDREAWLEAYILSKMDGLVMNKTPSKQNGYEGTAGGESYFAKLAKNMGNMPDDHVMKCELR